jgi:hypothetical protein
VDVIGLARYLSGGFESNNNNDDDEDRHALQLTIITCDHHPHSLSSHMIIILTHYHHVLRSGASQGKDIYTVLREYTLLTGTALSEH